MLLRKYLILPILIWLSATTIITLVPARAKDIDAAAITATENLIDNGGYAVLKNNNIIIAHNLHTPYVPASIIKIATALAALEVLGPEFRFQTNFYLDRQQNLYIQGFGDPFLISEEIAAIIVKLKDLGCTKINDIYLDSTAFQLDASPDGAGTSNNPYDAENSALAANFNTINIIKDKTGEISSAEEQTPTLPLMAELAEKLPPGIHRVNINQTANGGETIISRYVGELFRAFQKQENIAGEGMIAQRKVPKNLNIFYTHHSSKTLKDIIAPLMLYSSNFIANQLFLAVGSHTYGFPGTWEKSRKVMTRHLQKKYNLSEEEFIIIEGSGLSGKNRVSPHIMIQLLDAFKPYANLLPQEDGKFLKSGTLKGVYSYAGYFTEKDRLDSFVLLLNQEKNSRDRLLDELERIYHGN
jgi:D-alanyl-D-alanine carboxypeptidase/D-alanyl-D-alanine-endopeptidase (penicillin-binding protein 4)